MSVIGIDIGNENSYIAVARQGGIETIANEYSQRVTPTYVAFGEKNRELGVSAKNKQITNLKNTIYGFKHLLGRKFKDPYVQAELAHALYDYCEMPDGSVGVKVRYLGEELVFSITQIVAMILTKLKEVAETALRIKVNDCVINVPSSFTDSARRALLDASQVAGLNALRLMNETLAVALAHGFYKQDLPEDKPRNIVFVDMGQSSLQICAVAFTKGKLKVLASVSEPIGGRDFDSAIAKYFIEDFKVRYKLDVLSNKRAIIRLLSECERLKKQMSANPIELPLNIECFMEDKDVTGKMKRELFEKLSADVLARTEDCMRRVLQAANLKVADIHSIEIVGGSTRIPAIKSLVQKIFGCEPSTTLNQDEAVARGCAIQCAMLSPNFKVREFSVVDAQPYPINITWDAARGEDGEMEIFPRYHQVPFSKMLTFFRSEPFSLIARYADDPNIPTSNPYMGTFLIQNVAPTPTGDSAKIKVKVRVNLHGVFSVCSASMLESQSQEDEIEATDDSPETEDKPATTGEPDSVNGDLNQTEGNNKSESKDQDEKKPAQKKKTIKSIDLPIDVSTNACSSKEINDLLEREGKMIMQDKMEKERIDSKNQLEEYVYEMRSLLSEKLEKFISEKDREMFNRMLEDTENWLYDEGEDVNKGVYTEKYGELRKHGQPVVDRAREFEERPGAIDEFGRLIQTTRKFIDMWKAQDENLVHISKEDVEKVEKALHEKQDWLDRQMNALSRITPYQNPPVLVSQIRQEKDFMEKIVRPVMNSPKPKAEPPPPAPEDKASGESNANQPNANTQNSQNSGSGESDSATKVPDADMEVD